MVERCVRVAEAARSIRVTPTICFIMKKRAFLIHGWEGSPDHGWFPWLKMKLEKEGFDVVAPAMPDPAKPRLSEWVPILAGLVRKPDESCFFVGHSLGCITILRFLESLPIGQKVGGVVLVAGFGTDLTYQGYQGELSNFFETPLNWNKIRANCQKFVVVQSDNDEWVPARYGQFLSTQLQTEMILMPSMKHFSGDDGITQLPIALESILNFAK